MVPASKDRYILLLPTPGFAYWQCDVTAGQPIVPGDQFIGYPYSDYVSMFESGSAVSGTGSGSDDIVDPSALPPIILR